MDACLQPRFQHGYIVSPRNGPYFFSFTAFKLILRGHVHPPTRLIGFSPSYSTTIGGRRISLLLGSQSLRRSRWAHCSTNVPSQTLDRFRPRHPMDLVASENSDLCVGVGHLTLTIDLFDDPQETNSQNVPELSASLSKVQVHHSASTSRTVSSV